MMNKVKISKKLVRSIVHILFLDLPPESYDEFMPTSTNKLVDLAKFNNCEKLYSKEFHLKK